MVLDVGCGSGLAFEHAALRRAAVRVGVDPSEGLLARVPGRGGLAAIAGGESLPFRSHCFDLVISLTALHHCEPPEAALDEILRVGRDRFALTILKRSARREKTERLVAAIETRFQVVELLEDQHDHIYILRRRAAEQEAVTS